MSTGFAALAGGARLAYQRDGQGTPLLLISPLGGTAALWGAFRDRLAASHAVISYDHRGAGRSSACPLTVSTRDLAGDALALLDHLGVARAHVFGESLGGMTATWLAILAPNRVASLCLASTPARGLSLSRLGLRRELVLASSLLRPGTDVEATLVAHILSHRFRAAHAAEAHRIEAAIRAQPASRRTLLALTAAALRHDARDALPGLGARTLVLAGDRDHMLGREAPRALAAAIADATFDTINGAGHSVTLEQPLVVAERVSDFLRV